MTDVQKTETETELETTFDVNTPEVYDPTIVDDMDAFELIKANVWMRGVVTSVKKHVCGTGTKEVEAKVKPLDAEGRPHKPAVRWKIYPVMRNAKDGRTTGANGFYYTMRSLDPKFPRWPHRTDTDGYANADGETISAAEYQRLRTVVKEALAKKSVEMWNDPSILLDEEFFFRAKHEQGKDGKTYASVNSTLGEEPREDPVIYENFIERNPTA